ncbi:MAG TPA: ABC transporter permease [Bacillota bacterium]|nr:ABC transporter permease [Bacillota bacterium]
MAMNIARLHPGLRRWLTSFWAAWKVLSNWTDPLLFGFYLILRPMATMLILVVIVHAVGGGDRERLMFLYVGNAFFLLLMAGALAAEVIPNDRDWHNTIKAIYLAPGSYMLHVLGWASAQLTTGAFSAAVLLTGGLLVLDLPLAIQPGRLILVLALTTMAAFALSLLLASLALFAGQGSELIRGGTIGAIYLLSGLLFPPFILPSPLKELAQVNPMTHLATLFRASLGLPVAVPDLVGLSLSVTALLAAAICVFRHAFRGVIRAGIIDRRHNY